MKVDVDRPVAPTTTVDKSPGSRRPRLLWPLVVVIGFLSSGGFVGGLSFLHDRSGSDLGAKLSWLQKTPVHDFFLPGLLLIGVYGAGCLLLIAGLAWRISPGPVRRLDARLGHHWAWFGTIVVGAVLVMWIVYEFIVLPDQMVLQPILIGVGSLMVALPLTHSMRLFYSTADPTGRERR